MFDIFGGGDDMPSYEAPRTDPEGRKQFEQTLERGTAGIDAAYAEGNKAAQGMMPTRQNAYRDQAAMARSNRAQTDAILRKGETLFSKNIKKLMLDQKLNREKAAADQLTRNFQMSSRQKQLFRAIEESKTLAEANKIAARNNVIGKIMQVGGAIVGAYFGGPAGAAAGYQAGGMIAPQTPTKQIGNRGLSEQSSQGYGGRSAHSMRNADGNGLGDFNDRMYGRRNNDHGDF